MINSKTALRQAQRHSRINITEGTKGGQGKQIDRCVTVTPDGLTLVKEAAKEQGKNQNLIPDKYNYIQWRHHACSQWRIAETLYRQFQVGPYHYRLGHIYWYLSEQIQLLRPGGQYRHWLTVREILKALGRWKLCRDSFQGP